MKSFYQDPPQLGNQFENDVDLRSLLERLLPSEAMQEIWPDLMALGDRVTDDLLELAQQAEREEPVLEQFDAWGRRIDHIRVSGAWLELDRISAEEGMVAAGYERKFGAHSRIYQFARLYLFNPSSAIYTCPLAMTDGAARLLEVFGQTEEDREAYRRLTSRDPDEFWTSGQWMTERSGGSDVSGTETVARLENGVYRLYGDKWFTSATTSQMAMTLARIEDRDGNIPSGSRGSSLFYVETRLPDGSLNHIRIHRLKEKLGTKALPTAELTLDGSFARLIGEPGHGVRNIATLFNITRIYNACSAIAFFRRGLELARDYAGRRRAFGKLLCDHPLHAETLAGLEVEQAAGLHLTFHLAALQGRLEIGGASDRDVAVLRLLTPLVKLYTARQAVAGISEILESFGGAGYVENTGLPKMLRDVQVLSIWEGTTNVLSLDALRAIQKDNALAPFFQDIQIRLGELESRRFDAQVAKIRGGLEELDRYLAEARNADEVFVQGGARQFAYSLTRLFAASLLLEHGDWTIGRPEEARYGALVSRWCEQDLTPLRRVDAEAHHHSRALLGLDI